MGPGSLSDYVSNMAEQSRLQQSSRTPLLSASLTDKFGATRPATLMPAWVPRRGHASLLGLRLRDAVPDGHADPCLCCMVQCRESSAGGCWQPMLLLHLQPPAPCRAVLWPLGVCGGGGGVLQQFLQYQKPCPDTKDVIEQLPPPGTSWRACACSAPSRADGLGEWPPRGSGVVCRQSLG